MCIYHSKNIYGVKGCFLENQAPYRTSMRLSQNAFIEPFLLRIFVVIIECSVDHVYSEVIHSDTRWDVPVGVSLDAPHRV